MHHMTRILASTIAALTAASLVLAASGSERGRRGDGHRHAVRAKLMDRFDADRDGTLSSDERAAIRAVLVARRGEIKARAKARALERFDTNGDGMLDRAERKAARTQAKAGREAGAGKERKHRKHIRGVLLRRALRSGPV